MQITSKPEWITPGILPLDDSVQREKIYQTLGDKYAYSPTAPNLSLNWVDYSSLGTPCSSGSSHCTVATGGQLSVVNQLKLLYSLNSKTNQDPLGVDDLVCDAVLREKIHEITGNKYAYSPTPHNISFTCADCSALSGPCSTGSSHCTVGSGGPLSDLDQWEPLISMDSKGIEDLLAMEEDVAQANSITTETATALAPVTCAMGLASCFPYDHFLVSANEWQCMRNHWKPIFTIDYNMMAMNEVEQYSTLVLTPAVNLTTVHLCVALPDCTLSVLLTRIHGGFRATGKLHFGAGGQKLASNIIAWIHQLRGNMFTSSATGHKNSIPWMNYSSQHAPKCILSCSHSDGGSVGRLSSDQVDSSSILILTRPVQLAISQLTFALQVCNLSGLFTQRHGNSVPVGQLLKAKPLSQIMSTMTTLRDIRVIPNFRTRKALQLASGTANINLLPNFSVDNTAHRGNKNNTVLSTAEKSLLPRKDGSSEKEQPHDHCNRAVIINDAKDTRGNETKRLAALPVDEDFLPQNHNYGLLGNYAGAQHPSANKKTAPTGCFKWLWRSKKKTALSVSKNDLTQNNVSTNEPGLPTIYNCALLPSANMKKKATGCFSWLWRSKKNNGQFCGEGFQHS